MMDSVEVLSMKHPTVVFLATGCVKASRLCLGRKIKLGRHKIVDLSDINVPWRRFEAMTSMTIEVLSVWRSFPMKDRDMSMSRSWISTMGSMKW
ncbi:hypothetical protein HAX54_028906 [Datura stramonium]|uniref:Uncharacterized protein n=1 Tax=Datura stramonium TaxID=4076 RepID=A0ABS8S9Z6_DATST|nr:hypothetical protein [Datura stramonium]